MEQEKITELITEAHEVAKAKATAKAQNDYQPLSDEAKSALEKYQSLLEKFMAVSGLIEAADENYPNFSFKVKGTNVVYDAGKAKFIIEKLNITFLKKGIDIYFSKFDLDTESKEGEELFEVATLAQTLYQIC